MRGVGTWGLGLVALHFATTNATACVFAGSREMILFREVPAAVDAPVMLDVTIVEVTDEPRNRGLAKYEGALRTSFAGVGRIDRVIKGDAATRFVRVIVPSPFCAVAIHLGERGILVGSILPDSGNPPQFEASYASSIGGTLINLKRGMTP